MLKRARAMHMRLSHLYSHPGDAAGISSAPIRHTVSQILEIANVPASR